MWTKPYGMKEDFSIAAVLLWTLGAVFKSLGRCSFSSDHPSL